MESLTPTQLKKLKEHKYSATGTSLVEPYMQIFWRWLVEQIPTTWAPNTLTVVGLILNIATSTLLFMYSPDGKSEAPRFVYLLCAIGLFLYQSLDAIDGKQARRTNTSSPLGELFDHGCDSVSTVFVGLATVVALNMGKDLDWMMYELFAAIFLFYMAHWQTYVTGTLRFGQFDVTESQLMIIAVYLTNFIFGSTLWDLTIPIIGMTLRKAVILFSILPQIVQFGSNFSVIMQGGSGKNKSTIAGTSTIFPVLPIVLVLALGVIISQKSETQIYENHPCFFLLCFGLVAAKITNKLVVAQMTKSEMNLFDTALLGPGMLFLNQYFNCILNEYLVLWLMFIYVTQDLIRYSSSVCQQICQFLGIYCFDITSSPKNGKAS
ncbi:CEPT1 [Mytilus edulis]|uniref:diacylglycerol cholinephosphotransferase n=1 Tax=Mytilus edulis TaxID=6550 RepID=A0A8S3RRA6_MYTED|nr:CEPT1 [Mytilus edulis]